MKVYDKKEYDSGSEHGTCLQIKIEGKIKKLLQILQYHDKK